MLMDDVRVTIWIKMIHSGTSSSKVITFVDIHYTTYGGVSHATKAGTMSLEVELFKSKWNFLLFSITLLFYQSFI